MDPSDLVELHRFSHVHEAELAISTLAAAGLDALLKESSFGGIRPETSIAGGGVAVLVPRGQVEEAREVLASAAEEASVDTSMGGEGLTCANCGRPLRGAVCPDCDAEEREIVLDPSRMRTHHSKLKAAVIIGTLLLMIVPVIVRRLGEMKDSLWTAVLYVAGGFALVVLLITILKSASDERL